MKTFKKTLLLFTLVIFVACNNDDYSSDNYRVDIATVINPSQSKTFMFQLDDNTLMWTSATNLLNYIPKDGQRIVANYTVLSEKPEGSTYNYNVKLNDVYTVLTKDIFAITPATQDSIGNDSIGIRDIWIGSDYLNVEFSYPGYDKIHYINLVSDASKTYTDGKIHLELRHNANADSPIEYRRGIVSFNIKTLKPVFDPAANSIIVPVTIVVHVNVPNQTADKTYEFKYPDVKSSPSQLKSLSIHDVVRLN